MTAPGYSAMLRAMARRASELRRDAAEEIEALRDLLNTQDLKYERRERWKAQAEAERQQAEIGALRAALAEQVAEVERLRAGLGRLAFDILGEHANPEALDLADTIYGRIWAVLAGQGDAPPREHTPKTVTVNIKPSPPGASWTTLYPDGSTVTELEGEWRSPDAEPTFDDAGPPRRITVFPDGSTVTEVQGDTPPAEPAAEIDASFTRGYQLGRLHRRESAANEAEVPAEPAPVQPDVETIERAARAAFNTALGADTDVDWQCLVENQIEHWRGVVRAVAAELGLPTGETQ